MAENLKVNAKSKILTFKKKYNLLVDNMNNLLPPITESDIGKVLGVGEDGELEFQEVSGGTEVIANPTLAGTEDSLTGLQVGNTKYSVGGGGSGSGYYLNHILLGFTLNINGTEGEKIDVALTIIANTQIKNITELASWFSSNHYQGNYNTSYPCAVSSSRGSTYETSTTVTVIKVGAINNGGTLAFNIEYYDNEAHTMNHIVYSSTNNFYSPNVFQSYEL